MKEQQFMAGEMNELVKKHAKEDPSAQKSSEQEKEVKLEAEDIRLLEEAIKAKADIIVGEFYQMSGSREGKDKGTEELAKGITHSQRDQVAGIDMYAVASIIGDDRDEYHYGESVVYRRFVTKFLGEPRIGDEAMDNIAIRKAMESDERFKKFTLAFIEAVKIVNEKVIKQVEKEGHNPDVFKKVGLYLEKNIIGEK